MSSQRPAVVDLQELDASRAALERIAMELEAPCRDWGVFHVANHGIPQDALDRFERAMHDLFDLPAEEKGRFRRSRHNAWGWYDEELTKNRRDWKEVFDFGRELEGRELAGAAEHGDGANRWPAGQPKLRRVLVEHFEHCERLARHLLAPLCLSLGLAPDALDDEFRDHASFLRLNRYPLCPDPAPPDAAAFPKRGEFGVHPHSDAGALTLLFQDEFAGLQMERQGGFETVEPVRGAITVNLGDMLRVWSNDRYRAPVHRAIASTESVRHSAPFFLNPGYHSVVRPRPELVASDGGARFRPVPWAEFRERRAAGDFADYGSEVQVDDYRSESGDGPTSSCD